MSEDIHVEAFRQSMKRLAAAGEAAVRAWAATSTAIRLIAAAERRVLYQYCERSEQARVLALYDRFL